ncbi:MAG: histidine kinase [Tepidanaerobacteraceae bacterium]
MSYKNLIVITIIVMLLFVIGIREAEKGLYCIMGLDIIPRSFHFSLNDKNVLTLTILGNDLTLHRYYKIGDIYTERGYVSIKINGKKIGTNSLIPPDLLQKEPSNLDKKTSYMYN